MEGKNITRTILRISHLPTWLLIIGFPVYWSELYFIRVGEGLSSPLAWILFLIVSFAIVATYKHRLSQSCHNFVQNFLEQDMLTKVCIFVAGFIMAVLLLITLYVAFFPPHLTQEWDVINYHAMLPRQHLILGSFEHIRWAADDLFLLPLQFSLAPFWLMTELPNKLPQFVFFLGILMVSMRLTLHFNPSSQLAPFLCLWAILGSHIIGVQMGTAMLDLVICYLLLAAFESLLKGANIMALIEFVFFFWAKPAMPVQVTLSLVVMIGIYFVLKISGFKPVKWSFTDVSKLSQKISFKKTILGFTILSIFIAGPFMAKSTWHAATPLFPLAPGILNINDLNAESKSFKSMMGASEKWTGAHGRNRYGFGYDRTIVNFVKHLWLLAVPEKGVNNRFDYPVGLIYLIVLGPFFAMFISSLRKKEITLIPLLIISSWCLWWLSTQQSRYLYIPLVLMIIVVISQLKSYSKVLMGVMMVALMLNALSFVRAHKRDFGKSSREVLRAEDLLLVEQSEQYLANQRKEVINLERHDVLYAQFPVNVTKEHLPHTLGY